MVAFYVDKIKNKIMNPDTKQAWKLEDVPNLWREKQKKHWQSKMLRSYVLPVSS